MLTTLALTFSVGLGALAETGAPAPDFNAIDQTGHTQSLKALKGKWVILYFYPKDNTSGCTLEAHSFRDLQSEFDKAGAIVLGVSSQDAKSHGDFAKSEQLGFPLLDDHTRQIAKAYGVGAAIPLTDYDKRITFLIDPGGVIRQVWPQVEPRDHAVEVLKVIQGKN
jgi:thioredoxin-dependent peroxiredoxin